MTTYLCTVGTSASQALMSVLPGAPRRLTSALVDELGGPQRAFDTLWPGMAAFDHQNEQDLRTRLSAEIHSLVRLGAVPGDRVRLVHSDTGDGEVCARLVAAYLQRRLGVDDTGLDRVPGLQVDDAARFRREGVPNLLRLVLAEGDRCGWTGLVLNATGGFKAAIPYMTLAGMFFAVDVAYIFDNGRELIRVPRLPVDFDAARLGAFLPAMERMNAEGAVQEAEFWGRTPHPDRAHFDCLIETDGSGMATLSAAGLLILERLAARSPLIPLRVYLGRQAWEDLLRAPREWDAPGFLGRLRTRGDVDRFAHRLSDGTLWLKPGSTADRYRVEQEGDRLLVYRILPHDEYERANGRPWSRRDCLPFTRFDMIAE